MVLFAALGIVVVVVLAAYASRDVARGLGPVLVNPSLVAIPATAIGWLGLAIQWNARRLQADVTALLVFVLVGMAISLPLVGGILIWGHNGGFCT